MSIFNFCPFANKIITEIDFKKSLINYLKSNIVIANLKEYDYFYEGELGEDRFRYTGQYENIVIKNIVEKFFDNKEIAIKIVMLDELSLYSLIEIFINVQDNFDQLCDLFCNEYSKINDKNYNVICLSLDKNLSNNVKAFLNWKNIKVEKNDRNDLILNFNSIEILQKSSEKIMSGINSFIKIKELTDEESLTKKEFYLSGFKNKCGDYFNKKSSKILENKFLTINNSNLKLYWQTLFSHLNNVTNDQNFLKIKKEYNNFSLIEKHKLCNEIFDVIIYINYKIAF